MESASIYSGSFSDDTEGSNLVTWTTLMGKVSSSLLELGWSANEAARHQAMSIKKIALNLSPWCSTLTLIGAPDVDGIKGDAIENVGYIDL